MMSEPFANLPDPQRQAGFYAEVPLKRLLAFFIDAAIVVALAILAGLLSFGLFFFVFVLMVTVVGFVYRVATLAGGSATWGMRLVGIELRRHDGEAFSLGDAILHTGAFYISFGIVPLQIISAILMLTTARGQGLTDMLLGTVALNRRARA